LTEEVAPAEQLPSFVLPSLRSVVAFDGFRPRISEDFLLTGTPETLETFGGLGESTPQPEPVAGGPRIVTVRTEPMFDTDWTHNLAHVKF